MPHVRRQRYFSGENTPLSEHPEFLEALRQYVLVLGEVAKAYREELAQRRKE